MKILRLIGMAVAAVMLSVATTSCDDDDDDNDDNNTQTEVSDDGIVVGEKKLIAVTKIIIDGDGDNEYKTTYTITYDSKGRLSTILRKYPEDISTERYEWGDGIITEYLTEAGKTHTHTYTLSGNFVTKCESDDFVENYTYKSNRVATWEYNEIGDYGTKFATYTWDSDKPISMTMFESSDYGNNSYTLTYSYSEKTCNGFVPDDGVYLETLHPELFGSRRNQLPDSMVRECSYDDFESKTTDTYTYTFDEDGYVKTMTVVRTESNGSNGNSDTYYYTWE